jgi:energy-coupling factor transport system ATP-binding protein
MEDVAKIALKVVVMNHSKIVLQGAPNEIFKEVETLEKIGLGVPQVTYLMKALREKGFNVSDNAYTIDQAKAEILRVLAENK